MCTPFVPRWNVHTHSGLLSMTSHSTWSLEFPPRHAATLHDDDVWRTAVSRSRRHWGKIAQYWTSHPQSLIDRHSAFVSEQCHFDFHHGNDSNWWWQSAPFLWNVSTRQQRAGAVLRAQLCVSTQLRIVNVLAWKSWFVGEVKYIYTYIMPQPHSARATTDLWVVPFLQHERVVNICAYAHCKRMNGRTGTMH